MKYLIALILIFPFSALKSQINFNDYFLPKTLRVDYIHAGDSGSEYIFLEQMKQEPYWGGSRKNLIAQFNYGENKVLVYDSLSDKLIYSRGYCTLFEEWQSTDEAKKVSKSFYETVVFPFPKNTVRIEIQGRNRKNEFLKLFELFINPNNYFINCEKPPEYNSFKVVDSGESSEKVDIVIIPDGYTEKEIVKFRKDAKRFAGYMFSSSPFKEYKDKFNIWAIEAVSKQSGPDIPPDTIWRNTVLSSSFYTFDSERYLMTYDMKTVRDIAANVPYDQIYILVNTTKYGGGGIYNYYNVCTSDNEHSEFVFIHEFGHGFAGLADEYYTSEVSFQDYFNLEVEPWQPNITTLVSFESKWKNMVAQDIPIPTPEDEKYKDKVGVFEGGGYVAKGVYRPVLDCTMKSKIVDGFCPVCKKAIIDMIEFYSE